jgi:hypothetical protein
MTVKELIKLLEKVDPDLEMKDPEGKQFTSITIFYGLEDEIWLCTE